jgi:hypothetical protein
MEHSRITFSQDTLLHFEWLQRQYLIRYEILYDFSLP